MRKDEVQRLSDEWDRGRTNRHMTGAHPFDCSLAKLSRF